MIKSARWAWPWLFASTVVLGVGGGDKLCGATAQDDPHYYYFKEKRPLTLDLTRIAVRQTGATAARLLATEPGIDDTSVTPMPIAGWSLVSTTSAVRNERGIRELVRRAAERIPPVQRQQGRSVTAGPSSGDFVSPVFIGDRAGPVIVTPDILVGFRRDVPPARAEAILAESNAGILRDRNWGNMPRAYRLRSDSRNGFDVLDAANRLAQRPEVMFAEPDMMFTGRGSLIPNDTKFPDLWGLHNTGQSGGTPDADMDAPEAWDITTGNPSILVVIIDTGVQQDHTDINRFPGTDTTTDPASAGDGGPVNACDNHGTWVAGCVSARINNSRGVVGVCPDCRSASARTFISNTPCDGTWSSLASWTVDTLAWAESIGARVTNNSNSYGFTSSAIAQKYADTRSAGMVHFASAGNSSSPFIHYPSSLLSVNAVAALNRFGTLASFSNFGEGLAFSAPGVSIWSTDRSGNDGGFIGDFGPVSGTSFASPYAAGVAGLMLSLDPGLSAIDVEQLLQESSVDLGDPGFDLTFGWGFVNAEQALQRVRPTLAPCEVNKLLAPDAAAGDRFGVSVSQSGDTAVVGAFVDDCAVGVNCGAAYVYRFDGTSWVEEAKLTASDAAAGDRFGVSVSLSGETAVVGALLGDCAAGIDCGSAYVYRFDGTSWVEEAKLTASDAAAQEGFGISVSVSSDTAVVGAHLDDCAVGSNCGAAYVYRFDGTSWVESAKLTASDAPGNNEFGFSVSLSGDTAVVGAPFDDCAAGSDCGSAYVFEKPATGWADMTETAKLTTSDAAGNDVFGFSVSLSGDTAVIGARLDNCAAGIGCGSAYVFEKPATGWVDMTQTAKLTASDAAAADEFGVSVSVSGDTAVVGAFNDDCAAGLDCGSAYVFEKPATGWADMTETAKLTASGAAAFDRVGITVSVSGDTAVVGADLDDCAAGSDCGAAYVFAVGADCNRNGVVDFCDIRDGTTPDVDGNGILDECECSQAAAAEPDVLALPDAPLSTKNRALSFRAGEAGVDQAIRVTFVNVPPPHDNLNGLTLWVTNPKTVSENSGLVAPDPDFGTFTSATLGCAPFFTDWTTWGVIHVVHESIVPGSDFSIEVLNDVPCSADRAADFSLPLLLSTSRWGDLVKDCTTTPCGPPDDSVDVTTDVTAILDKFRNLPGAPIKARCDLQPATPDLKVDIQEVTRTVDAFRGFPYPFPPVPRPCP